MAGRSPRPRIDHGDLVIPVSLFLLDAVVITAVSFISVNLRTELPFLSSAPDVRDLVLPIIAFIVVLWLLTLVGLGAYRKRYLGAGSAEFRTVIHGSLLTAGAIGISAYLFQYPLSRAYYFLLFTLGVPVMLLARYGYRKAIHAQRRRGRLRGKVLVAGDHARINNFVSIVNRESWVGYDVIGALAPSDRGGLEELSVPLLGTPDDALRVVRETGADAVVFVEGSLKGAHHFNHLARELEEEAAHLVVIPSLAEISSNRVDVQTVAGLPLLTIAKPQAQRAGRWVKRSFDIVVALLCLVLLSPVIAIAALCVKLEDGGPIIFRQPRVGRRGVPFDCLKIRSMVTNADEIKKQLMAQNEGAGVLFKMKNDPRVTRTGRFIRRYSIDELPQLWNVVRGDMSLVGPRPALQSEVNRYKAHVMRRLDVRPGITGLWQVSGRSDLSWDDAVRLDLYYVDNWSFVQDLTILLRTVRAVFASDGAY